jgi:hypothetical protein
MNIKLPCKKRSKSFNLLTAEGLAELRSPAELAANCGAKKLRASPKRQEDQGTES